MKRHLDIHIEADFGSDWQEEMHGETIRTMIKAWKDFAEAGHKKTVITVIDSATPIKVTRLGMDLHQWRENSCLAHFGYSDKGKWATLYDIQSFDEGKGHATALLLKAKKYYENLGYEVGGSVALNERMTGLYKKVGYKIY